LFTQSPFLFIFLSLIRCLWQISLDQSWRLFIQIQPTQVSWLHMTMKLPCPSEIIDMIISCQRMRLVQEDQTEKRWMLAWESFEMASRLFASIKSRSLDDLVLVLLCYLVLLSLVLPIYCWVSIIMIMEMGSCLLWRFFLEANALQVATCRRRK
jgi:hypothetical protein